MSADFLREKHSVESLHSVHECILSSLPKVKLVKGFDGIIAQFRGLQKVNQLFLEVGIGFFSFNTWRKSGQIDQKDSLGIRISK